MTSEPAQAMEERCTALSEDQEKLAATNLRIAEENRRLQEVSTQLRVGTASTSQVRL